MTYLPGFENPIGYLVGIRQWRFHGLLLSICTDYLWGPWKAAEGDVATIEYAVSVIHGMGIYAVKQEHGELLGYEQAVGSIKEPIVTGRVALWGRVAEHEKGYRAQYAYPISLDHCTHRSVDLDKLRSIYLCPPTEITKAIVEERMQWISEQRRAREQLLQSQYQRLSQLNQMLNQQNVFSPQYTQRQSQSTNPQNQNNWSPGTPSFYP